MPQKNPNPERRERANRLRAACLQRTLEGASQRQIAKELGVSVALVCKYVQQMLQRQAARDSETAALLLTLRTQQLRDLLAVWLPKAADPDAPDAEAVKTVLRLLERETKYLGLDAPDKQQVEVSAQQITTIEVVPPGPPAALPAPPVLIEATVAPARDPASTK